MMQINNPMALIQMFQKSQNPAQFVMQILESQMANTPVGQNLLQLAKSGDNMAIEQFARNLLSQNGKDFDREFQQFKNMFKL